MAERTDLTVDWSQSPRIIWVNWTDEASRELTLQDLHDTAKGVLEYDLSALDDPVLLESEGKAALGNEQSVAITTTLQNAVVAFRQNTTIDVEGIATSDDATGTRLTDTNATFVADGVRPGAHVHNETDNSMATVLKVVSQTELYTTALETGSTNQYQIGDAYDIINPARCSIMGGNLVAVDANGDEMVQFLPTTNVFVTLTSSASATVQELSAVQYSSYGGGVSLDMWHTRPNTMSGTTYPAGNKEYPTDTVQSAVTICQEKGFDTIFVIGNATFSTGDNITGLRIVGQNPVLTTVDLEPAALTLDCQLSNATVTGTLDGNTWIENCRILALEYIEGQIVNSMLMDDIYLTGTTQTHFSGCYSGLTELGVEPTIDIGGNGRNLGLEGYTGVIRIVNMTVGPTSPVVVLNMNAGHVIIDPTVAAGDVIIRGICGVTDLHTGVATVNVDDVIAPTAITSLEAERLRRLVESQRPHHKAYGRMLFWNPVSGDDANDGLSPTAAVQTFAHVHDLAIDEGHDVIIAMPDPSAPGGINSTEQLVISKKFVFLRGPGRDFHIKPTATTGDTVTITGVGVEVCGLLVNTANTGIDQHALRVSADFAKIDDIWIETSKLSAVEITGSTLTHINRLTAIGTDADAIVLDGGSDCILEDCCLCNNGGNGIRIKSGSMMPRLMRNHCVGNSAYGIKIEVGAEQTVMAGNQQGSNMLGDILDEGTATFNYEHAKELAEFGDGVHVASSGGTGTAFPWGTANKPVNNCADAMAIAAYYGLRTLSISGPFTLDEDLSDITLRAEEVFVGRESWELEKIDLNNKTLTKAAFKGLVLTGTLVGTDVEFRDCYLVDIDGLVGEAFDCRLDGNLALGGYFSGVGFVIEGDETTVDFLGDPTSIFSADIDSGYLFFQNMVAGSLLEVNLRGGEIELDGATCTGGDFYAEGYGTLFDEADLLGRNILTTKANHLLALETIPRFVLSENVARNAVDGSLAQVVLSQQAALNGDLSLVRKLLLNRLELREGSVNNWILYDDDGVTPFQYWDVTDQDGNPVVLSAGAPTERRPRYSLRGVLGDTTIVTDTTVRELT